MSFKVLPQDTTGYVQVFRFHGFYRVTSHYFAIVTGMDLEEGMDVFVPVSASDSEFGAVIRRCHDATRFIDWQTLPKGVAANDWERNWRRLHKVWEQEAVRVVGCETVKNLYANASNARGCRTNEVYAFFNSRVTEGGEFSSVSDNKSEYREFIIQQPTVDEKIGEMARAALNALVHGL